MRRGPRHLPREVGEVGMSDDAWTGDEMLTVAASRAVGNDDVCFVGIGQPSAACNLARLTHAPRITLIYESGTIGAQPTVLPLSIGDGELCSTALTTVSVPEFFRYWLQSGRITVGFLGAAQLDRFGNINTTVIGPVRRADGAPAGRRRRARHGGVLPADLHRDAALVARAGRTARLRHLARPRRRAATRAPGSASAPQGPAKVITDLCILEPDPITQGADGRRACIPASAASRSPPRRDGRSASADTRDRNAGALRARARGAAQRCAPRRPRRTARHDRIERGLPVTHLSDGPNRARIRPTTRPATAAPRCAIRKSRSIVIPHTLSELTGPVYPYGRMDVADSDLTRQHAGEPLGERIIVEGRVLDEDGRPLPQTLVEIWQANAAGRYTHRIDQHAAPLDPNFSGAGRTITDDEGRYRFVTIRPGAYPWKNHHNAWRPAHIHFSLFGTNFLTRLITQMYFPGDPLLPLRSDLQLDPGRARARSG